MCGDLYLYLRCGKLERNPRTCEWGVLVLFGGGLTLSIVMKDSGASKIMADSIVQFVQTKPLWVLCFVMTAFIIFLTELHRIPPVQR